MIVSTLPPVAPPAYQNFQVSDPPPVCVIYQSPPGHPGKWVAQRYVARPDRKPLIVADDIEAARAAIRRRMPDAQRFPPDPWDDPAIVEVWL